MIRDYKLAFQGRRFGIAYEVPLSVKGGPFMMIKDTVMRQGDIAVCLKEEARKEEIQAADIFLPIHDFSIPKPSDRDKVHASIDACLKSACAGYTIYAGCMGGTGRTGLFLALIAKAAGVAEPLQHVRANYKPHAVETKPQEAYLAEFDVTPIHHELNKKLFWVWAKAKVRGLFGR